MEPNHAHFTKRKEVNGADASRIMWRRILNVNATIEIGSLVSRGHKTIVKLAMTSRWAALSCNISLIPHFLVQLFVDLLLDKSTKIETSGV